MEARNRTLPEWFMRVRTRQIMLPRFQRMESWGQKEITDLLEAVLRGLPVGSVLTLEVGDEMPFVSRPIAGAPTTGERVIELLLDGQQRLTALWRALHNNYEERTYYVRVPPDNSDNELEVVSQSRWRKDGRRFPLWADNPAACWARRLVPIQLLRPDPDAEAEADGWIRQALNLPEDLRQAEPERILEYTALKEQLTQLRHKIADFNLPFLSLPVGTPKEVALNVFIKLNTNTVKLTTFDIIVAQTEEATGQSLHDLVGSLRSEVPTLEAYGPPEDLVLGASALLQDRVPNQSGYLALDLEKMVADWAKLVRGAQEATRFLEEEHVLDNQRLPTESVLAPLIALWALVPRDPDILGNARILLKKYIWRAFFTDRYERAAATAALQDFRALRGVITEGKPESDVPCFNEKAHPFPTREELKQAGWPKKRDRLARAILLVSLYGGARDIADGTPVNREHLKQREYHHLFPMAYLREQGFEDPVINRALNCALVSWRTNRTVAAKEPIAYLRERTEANVLGEDEIRRRLKTHVVDFDSLATGEYEAFLDDRARLIEQAMRELCAGRPWTPV